MVWSGIEDRGEQGLVRQRVGVIGWRQENRPEYKLMLERTIKVFKLSSPEEVFVRQYQLHDFDAPREEHKAIDLASLDPELNTIVNPKDKPKDKKAKLRPKDNEDDMIDLLKRAGLSNKEIKELKQIKNELECQQYNSNSKYNRKELRAMKKKLHNKAKDIPYLSDENEFELEAEPEVEVEVEVEMEISYEEHRSPKQPRQQKQRHEYKQHKHTHKLVHHYPSHIDSKVIEESRSKKENKYYLGTIMMRNLNQGKIISSELSGNLRVQRDDLNRAIHGSEVYFQIINAKTSSGSEGTEREDDAIHCRIVGIKENSLEGKEVVGKIRKNAKGYVLEPVNDKFRYMDVVENAPKKDRNSIYQKYYLVRFVSWKTTEKFPTCRIVNQFGQIGDIETECRVLLQMNNVYESDFGEDTTEYLKRFTDRMSADGEYIIPEKEYKERHDLRKELIFTIDPLTARDFDDALSIKQLTQKEKTDYGITETRKIYEVGIHIADVSYFVAEGSPLDLEAQKRTTSVYLIHRVIPMLPRVLCETMCSLNPGVDRLTLSVWCYMDEEANLLKFRRFGRSIINSKARYTYEIAQDVIFNKIELGGVPPGFGAINPVDEVNTFEAIRVMNNLATKMRAARIRDGSMTIENHKKQFQLDEKKLPVGYSIQQRFEANFLVEEFMLLANVQVADFLVETIREAALLRRHMFPSAKKIATFKEFMKKLGIQFEFDKDTRMSDEIKRLMDLPEIKSAAKLLIQNELVFLLEAAEYFIVSEIPEEQWSHYALSYPRYTHFTSPIRRYPDILVHRQLLKVIQSNNPSVTEEEKQTSKSLIQACNKCKLSARRVSSGCEKIFMCLYLREHPVNVRGVISFVNANAINICVSEYDIRARITLKDLKFIRDRKFETQNSIKYLSLKYKNGSQQVMVILRELQYVNVRLTASDTFPIDYSVKMILPHPTDPTKHLLVE